MARRSRYNRKRRQGRFSFLYKVLVFAAICGAIAVALALFFKVETISVVGNSRYSADQIVEAGGISPGDNMFFLNKYNASEKITSALPYIETVRISRQLPGTLVVIVTECTAPAAIQQEGKLWLLSGDGKIVDTKPAGSADQYATVKGLTLESPQVGADIQVPEEQQAAARLLLAPARWCQRHIAAPLRSTLHTRLAMRKKSRNCRAARKKAGKSKKTGKNQLQKKSKILYN